MPTINALVVLVTAGRREILVLEERSPGGKSMLKAPARGWRSLVVLDFERVAELKEASVGPTIRLKIWNPISDLCRRPK